MRLTGIDKRERLSNRDVYGRACFLDSSLQLERSFGLYQVCLLYTSDAADE